MIDLNEENYPFQNKVQLFDKTINNSFNKDHNDDEEYISYDFSEYKWLYFNGDILQCLICQKAFKNYPKIIEKNEWTIRNENNFVKLNNKFNILLILKIHQFSENHLKSFSLINNKFDQNQIKLECKKININLNEYSTIFDFKNLKIKSLNYFNKKSENMKLLRNFNIKYFNFSNKSCNDEFYIDLVNEDNKYLRCLEKLQRNNDLQIGCNPWGRYLDRYSWLYLKNNNPGCKYCEEAFKLSLQMSFTKWTSSNSLAETISQDRPNRTLLQHDRSKNHKIAEDILTERRIISPPLTIINQPKTILQFPKNTVYNILRPKSEHPTEFTANRWNRFTKNYPWLYYRDRFFHCTYCENAYERHRDRMTHTSWTSSLFDCGRIKDFCKARHYFYDHQRSNNHRIATNILVEDGIITVNIEEENNEDEYDEESDKISLKSDEELSPVLYSNYVSLTNKNSIIPFQKKTEECSVLTDKQWQQLCDKYAWLVGEMGKCYGCRVCQDGRKVNSLTVNLSQWTQGPLTFTKTKYIQLRKSLWCHSITRNHSNAVVALQHAQI